MIKEIVAVTIALGNDGAERVLSELIREWDKQGHKVAVVETSPNRYDTAYKLPNNIERIKIKTKSKNKILKYIQEIKQLIAILKKRPNAVCVSFLSASSFILGLSSLFVKNKIVFSERNDPRYCPVGFHQRVLRNLVFRLADKIIFQTNDAKKYFNNSIQKKGEIIINPINGNLPEKFVGEREKVIVTACRLHPQKNLYMLIDAFSLLSKEFTDYKLVIYGQGVLEEKLKEYVKEKRLEGKVEFPGFCNDVLENINKASIFALSSNYEGISNAMLEAMAMGVPVVVTDCPIGGAKMIIENERNGLLVPVNDYYAMYKGMKVLLTNKKLYQYISDNGRKVRTAYPLEKIARDWIDIIGKL